MVAIPDIVRHYVPVFASVFSPEAFSQFQRDVSGVIGSENKTVDGINLSEAALFFIANRLTWQAHGITRIRRHRWPVEGDHEEGKADGLDQSQGRDFQAIYRPIALVAVTDSLRRAAQHAHALLHTLQRQIKTRRDGSAGSCRRHTQAQALWALVSFIATALSQGQPLSELMDPLVAALCSGGEPHTCVSPLRRRLTWAVQVKCRGAVCALPWASTAIDAMNAHFYRPFGTAKVEL